MVPFIFDHAAAKAALVLDRLRSGVVPSSPDRSRWMPQSSTAMDAIRIEFPCLTHGASTVPCVKHGNDVTNAG